MKNRFRSLSPARMVLIIGSIAVYLIILIVLLTAFRDDTTPEPVYGSLEGRYESDITLELSGKTLHYREWEMTNYLLIGVDKEDVTQITGHQNGGQADFLVVLSIDRINRTVIPVMLDRDTMAEMQTYGVFGHPAGTRVMQLCLAQAYSGINIPGSINTVQTVERLLRGVKINHYVVLDITAIPLVNDAIGGVEVTLADDFTSFDPAMTKGATLRLMGKQAEFFVRGRMTVADGTNASRMARQEQYLSAFLAQFRQAVQGNQDKLNDALSILDGHMTSDATSDTLLHDMSAYDGYEWKPLVTLSGKRTIDENGFAEFWIDEDARDQLVAGIWFR